MRPYRLIVLAGLMAMTIDEELTRPQLKDIKEEKYNFRLTKINLVQGTRQSCNPEERRYKPKRKR